MSKVLTRFACHIRGSLRVSILHKQGLSVIAGLTSLFAGQRPLMSRLNA